MEIEEKSGGHQTQLLIIAALRITLFVEVVFVFGDMLD